MGRPPPRLKTMLLMVFLSTNTGWLHGSQITGLDHRLHCVNDYLFTVRCTLSITAENNSSYWLTFTETYDLTKYECKLMKTRNSYSCSFQTPKDLDTFSESDTYNISLCHNQDDDGSVKCQLLDDDYVPMENIQPNAPCCLSVSHNSSRYHFTWNSTYEEHSRYIGLTADLRYQLQLYKRSDKVILHPINTDETHFSMNDDEKILEEGVEYSARVRSSPGQSFYRGQWSHWSPEIHWKATNDDSPSRDIQRKKFLSELGKKVFLPLCVTLLLLLLLCYAPVKMWRKNTFIPTPAPYFDSLYSDCKGDFKSWVVAQESPADLLKAEETLQIDTVTKCVDEQEEDCLYRQLTEEDHTYNNVKVLVCDAALLGLPYAVSTMAPQSSSETAAGGSGCRLYSNTLVENHPPWYCNEYCTLSSFQLPASATTEQHGGF